MPDETYKRLRHEPELWTVEVHTVEVYVGTDGCHQDDHLLQDKIPGLTNANCRAHARRDYTDAIKAADKAVKRSLAYQSLERIAIIYELEGTLKGLPPKECLRERQNSIKPLTEEYFTWIKKQLSGTTVLPKGKTEDGLKYSVNQEQYLKVFLENGNGPIDNSACERSIRTFCIDRKNWMFHDSVKGAQAGAVIYSLSETAKLNNLRPYYYFKHLLTELPEECMKPCR